MHSTFELNKIFIIVVDFEIGVPLRLNQDGGLRLDRVWKYLRIKSLASKDNIGKILFKTFKFKELYIDLYLKSTEWILYERTMQHPLFG